MTLFRVRRRGARHAGGKAGLPSEALVKARRWEINPLHRSANILETLGPYGYITAMQAIARINEKDCN
jgi:hypothetical protein